MLAEAALARRHPADVDWDVLDNPGIAWSGPIRSQGEPWEDLLEASGDHGRRSPPTFQTFDFFDDATRLATSAKTLDTRAPIYADRPSRIFVRLRGYIDRIERFDEDRVGAFTIVPGQTARRRLELAVPFDTTPEQVIQIQRAIDYAAERGIETPGSMATPSSSSFETQPGNETQARESSSRCRTACTRSSSSTPTTRA